MTYGSRPYGFKRPAPGSRAVDRRAVPDRRAWLAMLERAQEAVQVPAERPLFFAASLKGLTGDNFPGSPTDARRGFAKHFIARAKLWIDLGTATRTAFAPGLATDAKALADMLIEQGAAEAQAGLARMGFKED